MESDATLVMATRALVPRADNEGSLGIKAKRWGDIQSYRLNDIIMPFDPDIADAGKVLCLSPDVKSFEFIRAFIPPITIDDENKVLTVQGTETIWSNIDIPDIQLATTDIAGIVKIGESLSIDEEGILNYISQPAQLASSENYGLVKIGKGLDLDDSGKLKIDEDEVTSSTVTLFHSTSASYVNNSEYEILYTGKLIPQEGWYRSTFFTLIQRHGSGQIRVSITDDSSSVSEESDVFDDNGVDKILLDTSFLDKDITWTLTIEGKGSDCNISRIKTTVNPLNEFAPLLVLSDAGNNTNTDYFVELANNCFITAGINMDLSNRLVCLCDLDIGINTEAEVKVTVYNLGSSESVTATVNNSGILKIECPYPSVGSSILTCVINGRIINGSGGIDLNHYQLYVER